LYANSQIGVDAMDIQLISIPYASSDSLQFSLGSNYLQDGYLTVSQGREDTPLIASIINHKLVEWVQGRDVSIQFFTGHSQLTYLRAIKLDIENPTALGIHKIVENFQFQRDDIDPIQYLAIGRQMVWQLCDTKIVPIKGPSNPACWNIMIQAQSMTQTQGSAAPELSSIHNLHHIKSESELVLRAAADQKLRRIVGKLASTYREGYLSFACIFPKAGISFPCDRLNVDIPLPRRGTWKVGILVRF
jgi:hypothetical protein